MKVKMYVLIISVLLFSTIGNSKNICRAGGREQAESYALGYSVDMFPTVISSFSGKPGFAFQTWAGYNHLKVRLVAGRFYLPDSFIGNGFNELETSVTACIIDYVYGDDFSGFWFGSGIELWNNRITHKRYSGTATWQNTVMTIGGGYIYKVHGNIYLNPFIGVHYLLNNHRVSIGDSNYTPAAVTASASVKIGYYF